MHSFAFPFLRLFWCSATLHSAFSVVEFTRSSAAFDHGIRLHQLLDPSRIPERAIDIDGSDFLEHLRHDKVQCNLLLVPYLISSKAPTSRNYCDIKRRFHHSSAFLFRPSRLHQDFYPLTPLSALERLPRQSTTSRPKWDGKQGSSYR